MLTAGASASCSEPLPSHGANKLCREQRVRGAAWQAPGGTSAWHSQWARGQRQGMAPLGSAGPHNMGQVVLHPPRGVTPMAGAAGVRGQAEERSRAGSLHAAPPALRSPKYGCWEMGDVEGSQKKRCSGILWW